MQWQVSTSNVNWTNISGATKPNYAFTPTAAMSGDLYHAVYTNAGGSVATAPDTLTLYTPPVVIGNPVNRAVNVGTTVSFTASASGTPTPIMQWQTSTDGVH